MLKDWRVESQILEPSTNLDRAVESQCRIVLDGKIQRTTCILMTSWLGKCRSVCSRISMGNSSKRGVEADIVSGSRARGGLAPGTFAQRQFQPLRLFNIHGQRSQRDRTSARRMKVLGEPRTPPIRPNHSWTKTRIDPAGTVRQPTKSHRSPSLRMSSSMPSKWTSMHSQRRTPNVRVLSVLSHYRRGPDIVWH